MPVVVCTPSRHVFWSRDAIVEPLKEAIDARKRSASARTPFERQYWRREMRYQAQKAVAQCRREMRRRSEEA